MASDPTEDALYLLTRLSILNQLLDQQLYRDYWGQAVQLYAEWLDALCVRVSLFDSWALEGQFPIQITQVQIENWTELQAQITQWEAQLEAGAAHLRPQDQGVQVVDGPPSANIQLLHIGLVSNGVLYGGLTLVFDANHAPDPTQWPSLIALANLLLGHFTRAQDLQRARFRLENVSLL